MRILGGENTMSLFENISKKLGFEKREEKVFMTGRAEDVHKRMGSNPHAAFEQMHPAVNKEEPAAFANPVEAGAKKLSEEQCGMAMPGHFTDDLQPRLEGACRRDSNTWMGSDPHAAFEQMHPAVNKEEPAAFANACESGAKKPSEAQMGKPMPQPEFRCQ
jgi:hypothetical protein